MRQHPASAAVFGGSVKGAHAPKSPRLALLLTLPAVSNPRDALKVLFLKHGIVVCEQGGALPGCEPGIQQRYCGIGVAVEHQPHRACARIVRILQQLLAQRRALGVGRQNLA